MSEAAIKPVRSWRWPIIVVVMLAIHMLIMMTAVTIASRARALGVVPNYYDKAVHWDQEQAALRQSKALGWQIFIHPASNIDSLGKRDVLFELLDAQGKSIAADSLEITYFHHAHAEESEHLTLNKGPDAGEFGVKLPMRYAGLWEFHFVALAQGKRFVSSITQTLSNDGGRL
jgi:nitrogen fixation protein FixH